MGAWGEGPFDNDSALDWLSAATDSGRAIEQAFDATIDTDYLDVDDGSAVVAAAAVIAAAVDGDVSALPKKARVLAGNVVADGKLRVRAVEALDRVLAPASELAELWDEGDDGGFRRHIEQLRARIGPASPS